jgi:glucose/arabinose dehydrogenase
VALADPGDGSGRLFIVQRGGTIRIWQAGALLPGNFLSIAVDASGGEEGLLGLAFHPDYTSNGYFFVNYTAAGTGTVIARFQVQSAELPGTGSPNFADPATEDRLLTFPQPFENHNGGDLHFGPDGYLYVATGDGGDGGDPQDNAQDTGNLLGKILRLDVDASPPQDHDLCGINPQAYAAPADPLDELRRNPFVDADGCDEIWHYGLRNPWRFSFDRQTGDIFIGDVGQGEREEVDFRTAGNPGGANWGWRCYEGNNTYNTTGCGPIGNYLFPIHDYANSGSSRCAVTGGFRYRGTAVPTIAGAYVFADYCTGEIWTATESGGAWTVTLAEDAPFNVSSFGEDAAGELYVIRYHATAG